jgi:alpha-galactosidase
MKIARIISLLVVMAAAVVVNAVEVSKNDMADAKKFMAQKFDIKTSAEPVFSFMYDGKSSKDFLKNWNFESKSVSLDKNRKQTTFIYTDPATKLQARCVAVQWLNFPVVEWTVYLKNKSNVKTPVIRKLRAINTTINQSLTEPVILHHIRGDDCSPNSYAVKQSDIAVGSKMEFAPIGGRPTNFEWPYYNFDIADKGFMLAIGWPGQWSSAFSRDIAGLHLKAGQELTNFVLLQGEEVRTPLIAMMFYNGDWIRGQNLWRQWMISCNFPKDHGKQLQPPLLAGCSSKQFDEMVQANEQSQKDFIDGYLKRGIKLDYWWMDAGWYGDAHEKGWYAAAGTWEVDRRPNRFPNGMRPISDYAHSKDVKIIVWFEPERAHKDTWLTENHSEWILGGANGGLLNLGNPEAWTWLVNHIDKIITDEGINLYRQDYNIDPLGLWRANDANDRQGITENKYVVGYLAYWDELLKRHPGMLIDSCASGGRRNDLETMRRAVPLLRSDYIFEPLGNQAQSYGISLWLPFYGTGFSAPDSFNLYDYRSNMCPSRIMVFDVRVNLDDKMILKHYKEWQEIAPNYYGDFYPLTPWNVSETDWIGWQFNRTDTDTGFVSAFRRPKCDVSSYTFKLSDLETKAKYCIENFDTNQPIVKTGEELMATGLTVKISEQPGSAIIKYSKVR